MNPPRLTDFNEVHFLPDPMLNKDSGEFMPFVEVYGTQTDDSSRPSLKGKAQVTENDKKNKAILISGIVNMMVFDFFLIGSVVSAFVKSAPTYF